jgi:hypothetical protein
LKSIWNENIENSKISGSEFEKSPVTPKPNYEAMLTPGISNICHIDVFIFLDILKYSKLYWSCCKETRKNKLFFVSHST